MPWQDHVVALSSIAVLAVFLNLLLNRSLGLKSTLLTMGGMLLFVVACAVIIAVPQLLVLLLILMGMGAGASSGKRRRR